MLIQCFNLFIKNSFPLQKKTIYRNSVVQHSVWPYKLTAEKKNIEKNSISWTTFKMISYFGATLLYSTYVYTSHDWWADTDKQRARHKKQLLLCFIIILIKWNCAIFHKWNTNLMQISGWRENKQQLALLYAWFVCMCAKLNFHNQFHAYMFIICGCLMLNAQCSLLMLICLSYVIIIFFGNSFSFLSVPLIYLRSFLASVLFFFIKLILLLLLRIFPFEKAIYAFSK